MKKEAIKLRSQLMNNMKFSKNDITAIILAGGRGSRLGNQNKGLIELEDKPFVSHLLQKFSTQSKRQIISANNDISLYKNYNTNVIEDQFKNYQGPLSGIISCKPYIKTALVLTIPCDSPIIPDDLTQRLLDVYNSNDSTKLCVVHDVNQMQNLFMLFDAILLDDMSEYFQNNNRKVGDWINRHQTETVDFSDKALNFINVNDESNLTTLRKLISQEKI